MFMETYDELKTTYIRPKDIKMDLLWHTAYFFKKRRPGWSGLMSGVSVGERDEKADFTMLPVNDLDPNDYSCNFYWTSLDASCKTTTRNSCGTTRCSCRKQSLKCVTACGDCWGELCSNMVIEDHIVEDDDDDEQLERNIFDLFD